MKFSEWFETQLIKPYVYGLGEPTISIAESDLLRVTNSQGLWQLTDYVVTSVAGGSVCLEKRNQ